jgi:hypothetical protein
VGPARCEHGLAVRIAFDLEPAPHPGAFEAEVDAPDAGE